MLNWHEFDQKALEEQLETDGAQGLLTKEAKERQVKYGSNELDVGKKVNPLFVFLAQFNDFMVYVLFGATAISFFLGDVVDAIAILTIVFMNGVLGFFQEYKAERSLEALKEMSAPKMTVLRDQKWVRILTKEVVPGDIVKFSSGDRIGADLRILKCTGLQVEESALTGESVPVHKTNEVIQGENLPLGDLDNMCFSGTLVTGGSGEGVVVATGMQTEMGKIAKMMDNSEKIMTPLQRRLEHLGKVLIAIAVLLTILVVVLGVYQGQETMEMFLAGVSLAVAAIPEGLPAIVTVALSLGVQRMIKKKALVRKLQAVETLGCASVICSDKTGTMTQNKMLVTRLWAGGQTYRVTGEGYNPKGEIYKGSNCIDPFKIPSLKKLLSFGVLCNHADIIRKKDEYICEGDPTEGALVASALKGKIIREDMLEQYEVLTELPFDSERKMMSVIVRDAFGERWVITKGAPEILLGNCTHLLWGDQTIVLSTLYIERVEEACQHLNEQALRTIGIAYRKLKKDESLAQAKQIMEKNLCFIGLQGMYDPPRKEVKAAIQDCKSAGIRTVMITGDHVLTATAIANDLGLLPASGKVMDGATLEGYSDEQFEEIVDEIYVYARVSPMHKLRIVKALQKKGHIVAMTGDGVNDAPAIKRADIGIAMGISGTDVSKEASDIILMDDNFATIQGAIAEGRNIYENIRKFIRYLLASNVGEILVMLFAMLLALPLPLVPIQILWVNLVTDGLPAMALGLDKAEGDVMNRKPRHKEESIFSNGLGWKIISRGFLIGVTTLLTFIVAQNLNPNNLPYAQTIAFATLVLTQLIHVFDCRSAHSVLHRNPFGNMALVYAVFSSLLLMLVVIYYPPLQEIFHTESILLKDWLLILGMSSIPTFLLAGFAVPKMKVKKTA